MHPYMKATMPLSNLNNETLIEPNTTVMHSLSSRCVQRFIVSSEIITSSLFQSQEITTGTL